MKDRRPRKLKKIAKKREAAANAIIMMKAALVSVQGAIQTRKNHGFTNVHS